MPELQPVFDELRAILHPYAAKLEVKTDTPSELYVDTRHILKNKNKELAGFELANWGEIE